MKARIAVLSARIMALKPVRVFTHYGRKRGALLSAGLSYQAIFALFAALWVTFSIAGLFLGAHAALRDSLVKVIAGSVPGLIDTGSGGAIDPEMLLATDTLGWTGAIALLGLLFTALGWLASGRDAIRTIFGIGDVGGNILMLKLRDLGLGIALGAALIVSAALSVFSTAALDVVLSDLGIQKDALGAILLARAIGLLIALALDTAVLAAFFRYVARIRVPLRRLLGGALLGGVALGVLKALGSSLLGGASHNPLLASFAVIIGLLIWFNLVCQVILLAASWIAVGLQDAGLQEGSGSARGLDSATGHGRPKRPRGRLLRERR